MIRFTVQFLFAILIITKCGFAQSPPARGLIAYYPLDGTATDYSGNNLNGSMRNGITGTSDRFNIPNSAMYFDGVDDYIEIPDNVLFRFRDSFSISFFFNRTSASAVAELIEKRDWVDGSKSSFDIGLISPGVVRTAVKTGSDCNDPMNGWIYPTVTNYIQPNVWHCMTVTYQGGTVKSYLDGDLVGSSQGTILTIDSCAGSSVRLGIHWSGDQLPFQGKMDEVRFYNRSLDVSEVQSLCSIQAPPICSGSLGNPLIFVDFGSLPNPSGNLSSIVPTASTSLAFRPVSGSPAVPTPVDGEYTICNNTPYNEAWFAGFPDHTPGDINGNLIFFNASEQPGVFYSQSVDGLCANTTYEFAAWVANVLDPTKMIGVLPDLTFRIEKTDGSFLASFNTGGIAQSTSFTWNQHGFLFTVPAGVSTVILKIINNNVGGTAQPGNDLAIDDITFRPCGAKLTASFSNSTLESTATQCSKTSINIYGTSTDLNVGTIYRWQSRADSSNQWTDVTNSNVLTLDWSIPASLVKTKTWFRLLAGDNNTINSATCRVQSDSILLNELPQPIGSLTAVAVCGKKQTELKFNSTGAAGKAFNLSIQEGTQTAYSMSVTEGETFAAKFPLVSSTLYQILSIQDENGCINNMPVISVLVNPAPLPDAQLTPKPTCVGDSALVIFNSNAGNAPMRFTFTDGISSYVVTGAVDSKEIRLPIKVSNQTTIQLLTLYTESNKNCIRDSGFVPGSIVLPVAPTPQVQFLPVSPVCLDINPLNLNAQEISGLPGTDVYTGTGVSGGTFLPNTAGPGNHTVRYTFQAANGCTTFIEQLITVLPVPIANAGPDINICANTPVQLVSSGGDTYRWSPAIGLSDATIANPILNTNASGQYFVSVTNAAGCSDTDTLNVNVASSNKSSFTMANAFTPNGDGKNDCFGLVHWGPTTNVTFKIFNRWGHLVFNSADGSKCWDGTLGGKLLQTDTYVYILSAITGCGPINTKGVVNLVR